MTDHERYDPTKDILSEAEARKIAEWVRNEYNTPADWHCIFGKTADFAALHYRISGLPVMTNDILLALGRE